MKHNIYVCTNTHAATRARQIKQSIAIAFTGGLTICNKVRYGCCDYTFLTVGISSVVATVVVVIERFSIWLSRKCLVCVWKQFCRGFSSKLVRMCVVAMMRCGNEQRSPKQYENPTEAHIQSLVTMLSMSIYRVMYFPPYSFTKHKNAFLVCRFCIYIYI